MICRISVSATGESFPFRFMECVLDRRLETTADGKQYKFDIVCSLIVHGASVILPEDMIKLKLYRREGVFYVDRAPEVAMENE